MSKGFELSEDAEFPRSCQLCTIQHLWIPLHPDSLPMRYNELNNKQEKALIVWQTRGWRNTIRNSPHCSLCGNAEQMAGTCFECGFDVCAQCWIPDLQSCLICQWLGVRTGSYIGVTMEAEAYNKITWLTEFRTDYCVMHPEVYKDKCKCCLISYKQTTCPVCGDEVCLGCGAPEGNRCLRCHWEETENFSFVAKTYDYCGKVTGEPPQLSEKSSVTNPPPMIKAVPPMLRNKAVQLAIPKSESSPRVMRIEA